MCVCALGKGWLRKFCLPGKSFCFQLLSTVHSTRKEGGTDGGREPQLLACVYCTYAYGEMQVFCVPAVTGCARRVNGGCLKRKTGIRRSTCTDCRGGPLASFAERASRSAPTDRPTTDRPTDRLRDWLARSLGPDPA